LPYFSASSFFSSQINLLREWRGFFPCSCSTAYIRLYECLLNNSRLGPEREEWYSSFFAHNPTEERDPMPYFVYRIHPNNRLENMDILEKYRDAKVMVRELWAKEEKDSGVEVRMIFAETQGEAEKLLSAPRDERIIGDD
jgi:hypothetical protein